ncbi:MAG: hypothetical protein RSA79_03065 [Oscillospiraceae bacterium]
MSTEKELKDISLRFRRFSSDLLKSDRDTSDAALARLMNDIETTTFIHDTIHNVIDNIDFDFRECFSIDGIGWHSINIPTDEYQHLKAQYDYMSFILTEPKRSVLNEACFYPHSSKLYIEIVQKFLEKAFKPLIDFINEAISIEMNSIAENEKQANSFHIVQNIGSNYGTINAQGTGSIVSTNATNVAINDINELLSKIIPSIDNIANIPVDVKDNIKDDLESIQEQINLPVPKKSRMKKALNGIKNFAKEFSMKTAVSLVSRAVTDADWTMLIQKIDEFIK